MKAFLDAVKKMIENIIAEALASAIIFSILLFLVIIHHVMEGPEFLKKKYEMQTAPEVEKAVERKEKRSRLREAMASQAGEKVSQKPVERIQVYLDRFKEIIERKDPHEKERGIKAIKQILHKKFVIKREEVPESAFLLEQRVAREQGFGDVEITQESKERKIQQIISNQTQSLDKWVDYLSSPDATYPDWVKYWAFRSVTEMGKLEKEVNEQGANSNLNCTT